jgi:DNA-binding transcriptional regulator YiaG
MTGEELKAARIMIGDAVGDRLSLSDMAKLCGLSDPAGNGKDTVRKWETGDGPSGPVAAYLTLLAYGLKDGSDSVIWFFQQYVRYRIGIVPD